MASWLVAPQCTKPAAFSLDFADGAVSALTNGMARFPARAASCPGLSSESSALHCASIADDTPAGATPALLVLARGGLEIEHALQPAAIGKDFTRLVGGEQRIEKTSCW